MTNKRVRHGLAGGITLLVLVLAFMAGKTTPEGEVSAEGGEKPAKGRATALVPMISSATGLQIRLGLKDEKATTWDGEINLSEGKLMSLRVPQGKLKEGKPGKKGKVVGNRFVVSSVFLKKKGDLQRPTLHLVVDAPPTAKVSVKTTQGDFAFTLGDLTSGSINKYLDGQASVEREDGSIRLTGAPTEDDYPVLARGRDGTVWLAYSEYQPAKPLINERIFAGNFDELVTKGIGDQVLLTKFDGKNWHPPVEVTDALLDIWRPTVAVDKKGNVLVAWSQQINGNWDIYYRRYIPGTKEGDAGTWTGIVRLTGLGRDPATDFNVVATADAAGRIWLAWQAWTEGNFHIYAAPIGDNNLPARIAKLTSGKANNWNPAIAANSKGVFVTWDTYQNGNYDVMVHDVAAQKTLPVANSARFEARATIACDNKDRLWIAYEEGDEQWGKDYSTNFFRKIGFNENPGYALYITRTVKARCLVDGKVMEPADDLQAAFKDILPANRSMPRIATDAADGVWLLFRHHPLPTGQGEVWNSHAIHYDGAKWSSPRRLSNSANLIDNRPAIVPYDRGILTVFSGDNRTANANREQNDLFAALLIPSGPAGGEMKLAAAAPAGEPKMKAVHPNETQDIARIRAHRIDYQGKKLKLLRGEFHRHTEYTAHRDQDGTLEDSWRYSIDASGMDWMGNADHDNGQNNDYCWWQIQKVTDLFHHAPQFIAVHSYERSVVFPNGHRNVIMPKRGIRPLPRGDLMGTAEKGTPDTKMLYAYLKHFGGMCSSHTSGTNMGTDWRDNDPVVEPVVEIYQGHRHNYEHFGAPRSATKETNIGGYEPSGFIWNALDKGYKLGFQASSDHVSTHMSYAIVLTDDASRKGIIDAFKRRHSYAATDNIIVDVRSGKYMMGDIFETKQRPTFDIRVHGTAPITKLSIVRNSKYIHVATPNQRDVKLSFTDMDAEAGKQSYYYVRIEQADANLAWASPMWITYKP